jgi:protoporphyrinogen oxidase
MVSSPSGAELQGSDEELIEHVLGGLIRHGVVDSAVPVVFADVQRFDHAYVVYTVGYEEQVEVVRGWAESMGIYPHGRFGAFEYVNVDGCVARSRELAARLNGRATALPELDPAPGGTAP